MQRIRISWPKGELTAVLADTPTARKLVAALPCSSRAQTWGEEVYFSLPVDAMLEADAVQVVDPGTVCFWVEGSSLALPYGPTPASRGSECRLVSKVNILGKLEGDPRRLAKVADGVTMHLSLL
ncbi:MAG: cyclophilin-like fold protein [Nevskiales bacterium]